MTAPAYYASGGDVLFGTQWVREGQIRKLLLDYAKQGNDAFEAGQMEVVDEVTEFARQLRAAVDKAAQWSRAANQERSLISWSER